MNKGFFVLLIALIIFAIALPLYTQSQQEAEKFDFEQMNDIMQSFMEKRKSKIAIGMTQAQVRQVLGHPDDIHAGYPKPEECAMSIMPYRSGELLYTCWLYQPKSAKEFAVRLEPKGEKIEYIVNGREVFKTEWERLSQADSVYYEEGGLFYSDADMAQNYALPNRKIIKEAVDRDKTYIKRVPEKHVQAIYMPLFYVVFEKGSGLVSGTKLYFLKFIEFEENDASTAGMPGSKFKAKSKTQK